MRLTELQQAAVDRCRGNLADFYRIPVGQRGGRAPEFCGVFSVNVDQLLDVIAELAAPKRATCVSCKREMSGEVGCTLVDYVIGGQTYPRIPNYDQLPGCHDCAAPYGTLHHPGCDSETCPACLGQAISCGCDDPPEDDPGEAEAQRIAEVYADARAELDRGL